MASFAIDILPRLQSEDYFLKFKFIKSKTTFRQKTDFGFHDIEFYLHKSYDLKRGGLALEIRPVYGVRFDIVMKWFEKFSFKSLSDQRTNPTVFTGGKGLNCADKFYFLDSGQDFDSDFSVFTKAVASISESYFSKYRTINDYFHQDVLPILNKEQEMRDGGADWIFEHLTAVKLCDFERFDEMTAMLKNQIEFMRNRNEPNVAEYYDKFDIIFKELKNSNLK
jgi:hypothetical protein